MLNKRCHQLTEDRLQLLGCVKIAGLAERIALPVVAELRVIKRQFHIAREREWTLFPNLVVQQLEKVRILRHVAIITDDRGRLVQRPMRRTVSMIPGAWRIR